MSRGAWGTPVSSYAPRLSLEWELDAPGARWREIDATCCFVDISGFTALSERLARRGRIGAEELTEVLNHVFSRMLGVAYAKGGALLKFGGDALLIAFSTGNHALLATQAAVAMRAALREARTLPTSVGRVNLRMSVGIHTGAFHLFHVGQSHQELLVSGPAATMTTRMEQIAEAGEIVVSEATASRLPRAAVGAPKGTGRLIKWRTAVEDGPGPIPPREVPLTAVESALPEALRDLLTDRRGGSEHRRAGVAFVKFRGVDDLLASEGPEAAADALHQITATVQDAAQSESVTFLASDIDANGGKIILVSGVPIAREDDEGRLLRAARAVLDHPLPLPVRIGANQGHVFTADIGNDYRRTYTVMGDTVNLAARLMAAAPDGEFLVTGGMLERSRTLFESEPLEPLRVKGKAHPVEAYRVGSPIGPKGNATGSLPFRGRGEELAAVIEMFKAAAEGQGQVVVIEGERGVGKSRLVTEVASAAAAGTALLLQGEQYAAAIPYFPWRAPLRRFFGLDGADRAEAGCRLAAWSEERDPGLRGLLPLLAPVVDTDMRPTPESEAVSAEFVLDRVADVIVTALDATCPSPLLLVLEDGHWFDETTSAICKRVAKAARERPWLVCVTRRPAKSGFDPAAPDLRLELGHLDEEAVRELVDAATDSAPLRPRERDGIVARAGGNPLFLEELLRIVRDTDLDSLPDSLDAVVMRQIDSLPPEPRQVLLLASVLGRSFDRELLGRLLLADRLGAGAELLAGLDGQLVADGPNRLRFRHALLQEAAYQTLPFRTRLAMHRDVAEAIEAGMRDHAEAAPLLSLHFLAAQDWERTWRYARVAADTAQAEHAPAEAATHLERAVTAARHLRDQVDAGDLGNVMADLGSTRELLGEYDRADHAYRQAILAPGLGPRRRAELADRRAFIRSEGWARPAAAIRQLRAAADRLTQLPLSPEDEGWIRAVFSAREADIRWRQGRYAAATACSERAAEEAERSGNTRALALSLSVIAECLLLTGRPAEATQFGRALELYTSLGDHMRVALTLNNMAAAEFYNSRWDAAAARFEEAAEAFNKTGDIVNGAFAQLNLGDVWLNQGRWQEALTMLAPARRTLEACDYRLMSALATMALGRTKVFLGDTEAGMALLQSAAAALEETGSPVEQLEAKARLSEALVFTGQLAEARPAIESARRYAHSSAEGLLTSLIDRIELSLTLASGDGTSAISMLDEYLERARRSGADYEMLMLLALGEELGVARDEKVRVRLQRRLGIRRLPLHAPREDVVESRRR